MIRKILILFLQSAFFLSAISGQIDPGNNQKKKTGAPAEQFALFGSNEILEVTLSFDLTGFIRKTSKDDAFEGEITVSPGMADSVFRKITVRHRGQFRYENCSFPPVEINFKKPVFAYGDTGKIKKLKLVTHCQTGGFSDEYVLREYLVYRMFNVITDSSFRVRLARIKYIDTRKNRKPVTQYGFFIEPKGVLAERINSVEVSSVNLTQKNIVPEVMDRIALFSYMIAHWDWSVPWQHNLVVLKSLKFNSSQSGLAVPFDFDLTGVVNANYAIPSEQLGLRTIRDRIFLGICRPREEYLKTIDEFAAKKIVLYNVVSDFQYLTPRSKKDILEFLDEFFDQLGKPRSLDNLVEYFINNCKKL